MINATSYDETMLTEDQARFFNKKLKTRIQRIEDAIDIHLNLIGGLEKYLERSYIYKLQVLLVNEDKIREKDPLAMRLVDQMQSYNMYDAEEYFKQKQILTKIDREILELDFLENELPAEC